MRVLIAILTTTVLAYGQTSLIIKEFKPVDINGELSLIWMIDKDGLIGEYFELFKSNKFQYGVLMMDKATDGKINKTQIVTGKSKRHGDTLLIQIINKSPTSYGPEFLHFKLGYMIKGLQLTSDIDEKDSRFSNFICFVPTDKLEEWDRFIVELPNYLDDIYELTKNRTWYERFSELSYATEQKLWSEGILTNRELVHAIEHHK